MVKTLWCWMAALGIAGNSAMGLPDAPKVKMLWFDATANWQRLSTPEGVAQVLDRCVWAGVTDIAVDVKPISGLVLYPSNIAPRMTQWKGIKRDKDYDYLKTVIGQAHDRKLRVHAALNVFSEGRRDAREGLVYTVHPDWQTILYTPDGLVPMSQVQDKMATFVNPALPEVIDYELSILREVVGKYDVDGIILDRGRYDSIAADFSPPSKKAFEAFLAQELANWPEDVYRLEVRDGRQEITRGPYFKDWVYWRASLIRDFFEKARRVVKEANPKVLFGDYAGSWYPTYYEVGVNWASEKYHPTYDWARSDYSETAYAELLDFFCSGCYFEEVTKADLDARRKDLPPERWEAAMGQVLEYWYCVEGAAEMSKKVIMGAAPVYGSLYVLQYKDKPEKFRQAIQMCLERTEGVMIFDLVYIQDYGWWDILKKTFALWDGKRH